MKSHLPTFNLNVFLSLLLPHFLIVLCCVSCGEGTYTKAQQDSLAMRRSVVASPALSPEESLEHFKIEDGFDIKIVAAEPLLQAPVAADFDEKGRIWAVEMTGYMPDTAGTDETINQSGKIVILEDKDKDGVMDERKVFMDSLLLPRAICFYDDGILVAVPPVLWFVQNDGDVPGEKYVVDSNYTVGGNVEHQPNGLLRGIDNWIYSANSAKRYRRINGKWISQPTHFRGQWGITQDNYGRLFYNNNSANLLGDYFLPGLGAWNISQKKVSGFDQNIVPDNRTYPIRPTPGVNRGYLAHVLDDSLRLVHFTAACGPELYRGGIFGPEYEGNAFVAEPAANLIKRNILKHSGYKVSGKQAYEGREFLASDDERFRPENLYTGPDGALYVVDMYRGIIQDIVYLTPYLKNEIMTRQLAEPLNRGRMYKIFPKGATLVTPDFPHGPGFNEKNMITLVNFLDSPNAWVRTTAQRLLVDEKCFKAAGVLKQKMAKDTVLVGRIHACWALEGLGLLDEKDIRLFLQSDNSLLQQQAVAAAVSVMNAGNAASWISTCHYLLKQNREELMPYVGFLASAVAKYVPGQSDRIFLDLASRHQDDPYIADAIISGLLNRESDFIQKYQKMTSDTASVFYKKLVETATNTAERKAESMKKRSEKFVRGRELYTTYCQACHGKDGNGITSLGAPLNGSPWVTEDKARLLTIVLYGLTGPLKIGDKIYETPEVGGEMPAFGQNDRLSDDDIAQIISFIRNTWKNQADEVHQTEVKAIREKYKGRRKPFTQEELDQ